MIVLFGACVGSEAGDLMQEVIRSGLSKSGGVALLQVVQSLRFMCKDCTIFLQHAGCLSGAFSFILE